MVRHERGPTTTQPHYRCIMGSLQPRNSSRTRKRRVPDSTKRQRPSAPSQRQADRDERLALTLLGVYATASVMRCSFPSGSSRDVVITRHVIQPIEDVMKALGHEVES